MSEPAARILYIDDDPGLGRLVQRALQARGYVVETALDGEAGLARLQAGGIDLVALDHHMPGRTGLDLLPAIRALPEAPPVVYVSLPRRLFSLCQGVCRLRAEWDRLVL